MQCVVEATSNTACQILAVGPGKLCFRMMIMAGIEGSRRCQTVECAEYKFLTRSILLLVFMLYNVICETRRCSCLYLTKDFSR